MKTPSPNFLYIPFVKTLFINCFCILLFAGNAFAQRVVINLDPKGISPKKTEYQILEVLDHRIQKAAIGEVFNQTAQKSPVSINGNLEQVATRFFTKITNPKDSAQLIQIRIFELELNESFDRDQRLYQGDVQLALGFYVKGSGEPEHLLDYLGTTQYRRSDFRMDLVEDVITKLFQNSLDYFDKWYNSQKLDHRALAKSIRLEIIEPKENSTPDKVYYDPERPLTWEDFKARPTPLSKNSATIFTSFSVQGISLMDAGSVVQTLEISVYMLPYQSWVKSPSDYGLNHEQRHFDVVRIVADRLIHKLKNQDFDLDFYQARINEAYLDAYREMNRLQEFYDKQTQNGINTTEQEKWNQWIDEALAGDWQWIEDLLRR
jgi:hypothetical protein